MTRISSLARALVAVLLVVTASYGAFTKVGTTGANFLKIGVGRATGMGDAFVAIADDASAAYFNPAGLSQVARCITLNHADWFADLNHDNITAVVPVASFGTVAFSITALTMGKMQQTTIDNPSTRFREDEGEGLVEFGASDLALGVSYSRIITDKLSFGLTAKAVNQSVWDMTASAIGADLGLFYNTGFRSLRIGAAVTNFGTQLSFSGRQLDYNFQWTDSGPSQIQGSYKTTPAGLPTSFRFGVAYDLVSTACDRLTAAVDVAHPSDINETVHFGFEYGRSEFLAVRAGYVLNGDLQYQESIGWLTGLSAGLGLKAKTGRGVDLGLDYAFRYYEQLNPAHRLMLTVGF
jgi:hypothetical protein